MNHFENGKRKALQVINAKTATKANPVYKGYLIKENSIRNEFYIEKDGYHIATAKSIEDAKKQIDQLA